MKKKIWRWGVCVLAVFGLLLQMLVSDAQAVSSGTEGETEAMSETDIPDAETAAGEDGSEPESRDITDEVEIDAKQVRQSATDAVYEDYIRNHADPALAEADGMTVVNVLLVKQSLYEESLIGEGESLDSVMTDIEEGETGAEEKFITQISNVVALYELSEDSSYYVAYANTMMGDEDSVVRDWAFAENDNEGDVLTGCIYDPETGLAYIPKEYCVNEDGEQVILNVQMQFMQLISFGETKSEVVTSVNEEDSIVSVCATEADIFDVETEVQTETGLLEEDLSVAVNGLPVSTDYYSYDSDSGTLTLAQSPAMIQSVSVTTEEASLLSKALRLLVPVTDAYAVQVSDMVSVASGITLPDWVQTGTLMTGTAAYLYGDNTTWYYSYGYGVDDASVSEMVSLIENGGTLDLSRLTTQDTAAFLSVAVSLHENTLQDASGRTIADLTKIPTYQSLSNDYLLMQCSHISSPLGSVTVGSGSSQQKICLRFLNVDRSNNYAIIGLYTVMTHTQTGCAFFKISLAPQVGYGNIGKKDAQTGEVVAGAVYGIYTNEECTIRATDSSGAEASFTTQTGYPYSNTVTMSPGTYYVKETSVPQGYALDPAVKQLVITAGQTSWAADVGDNSGWVYDNELVHLSVQKTSAGKSITDQNPCYSLAGAVYGVYASLADAKSDNNRLATLATDASGVTGETLLDAGRYYIREITASPGYALCRGNGDDADADGIHVVDAVSWGQSYTVTCQEVPLSHAFAFSTLKRDKDSGKQEPAGTASLAGAIFQVSYYQNMDGSASGNPAKKWYYQTGADGTVSCSSTNNLLASATLSDGTILKSDDLYTDAVTNQVVFPLGTYVITELQAPLYYQLPGYISFLSPFAQASSAASQTMILKEENDVVKVYGSVGSSYQALSADAVSVNVYDTVRKGSVTVAKYDENGKPLAGVTYLLKGTTTGEEYERTTGADGKAVWEDLIPQIYELSEIKTVQGKTLLADKIQLTLPMEVTKSTENFGSYDLYKAVWDQVSE
ncbi:MAG: prealbumin-like fold domain-containing protein, partial [Clostridiales bacterium]|nr:prealbumin-like fold domain-containing protein [Clostridiales bacterium]